MTQKRTLQQAHGSGRRHRYNETMFKLFEEAFNSIPLAACIGGKALVVHGGLFSRDDVTLDELRAINRYKQPGNEGSWLPGAPRRWPFAALTRRARSARSCGDSPGLMVEMLWSDPQPSPGRSPSKRGVGIHFGPDVTKAFLERNGLGTKQRPANVAHCPGLCAT